MNTVWKKIWLECVHDFPGFPSVSDVCKDIVWLSHEAGFDEVDKDDTVKLLESHREILSNEDLIAIQQEGVHQDAEDEEE